MGFGRPKFLIFAIFSKKMAANNKMIFGRPKSHFEASRANCGRSAAVRAGPGEGNIRMGVGPCARNLRLNLEA